MSSPSFNLKASTKSAGSLMARLSPHLATRMALSPFMLMICIGSSGKLRASWMTGCHPKINDNKVIDFVRKTKITFLFCVALFAQG
jgi:hypothetical protein